MSMLVYSRPTLRAAHKRAVPSTVFGLESLTNWADTLKAKQLLVVVQHYGGGLAATIVGQELDEGLCCVTHGGRRLVRGLIGGLLKDGERAMWRAERLIVRFGKEVTRTGKVQPVWSREQGACWAPNVSSTLLSPLAIDCRANLLPSSFSAHSQEKSGDYNP